MHNRPPWAIIRVRRGIGGGGIFSQKQFFPKKTFFALSFFLQKCILTKKIFVSKIKFYCHRNVHKAKKIFVTFLFQKIFPKKIFYLNFFPPISLFSKMFFKNFLFPKFHSQKKFLNTNFSPKYF